MNSLRMFIHRGWSAGLSNQRRSGSNHFRAILFRYDCAKLTLVRSV
jgi:hypothetical protein